MEEKGVKASVGANYTRETREIHRSLTIRGIYKSVTYGDVVYLGRSQSDGKLEFRILDKSFGGKKLRLTADTYATEIAQ